MVFGQGVSKIIEQRIDEFLLEWKISPTLRGYRYIKETVVYMINYPSSTPYVAVREVAAVCGEKYEAVLSIIKRTVDKCTPPHSTFCIDNIPTVKEFCYLCMNTVLMEK